MKTAKKRKKSQSIFVLIMSLFRRDANSSDCHMIWLVQYSTLCVFVHTVAQCNPLCNVLCDLSRCCRSVDIRIVNYDMLICKNGLNSDSRFSGQILILCYSVNLRAFSHISVRESFFSRNVVHLTDVIIYVDELVAMRYRN